MAVTAGKEWVSYREAAEITGLSRGTIWKLISSGEIRAAKVGKAVRINRRSLAEYLDQQDYAQAVKR